jgi:hypothetical protein
LQRGYAKAVLKMQINKNAVAEEAEARMAKLNKVTLRAAMLRLFKAGKIKEIDEGSGGKTVHKIVRP